MTNPNSNPLPVNGVDARRTHVSDAVSTLLQKLSGLKKHTLNAEKASRNLDRQLRHQYHLADPAKYPTDASDTSSLITVPGPQAPEAPAVDEMGGVTPPKEFAAALTVLCTTNTDETERPAIASVSPEAATDVRHLRRDTTAELGIRPEITSAAPGFSQHHFDLSAHGAYLPLSLFTSSSLNRMRWHTGALPLKRTMSNIHPHEREARMEAVLLDTDAFEAMYGREDDLTHASWVAAARNYVRFAGKTGVGGVGGDWHQRWEAHFAFLKTHATENFAAVRLFDVRVRRFYHDVPFKFDMGYYEDEFANTKIELQIQEDLAARRLASKDKGIDIEGGLRYLRLRASGPPLWLSKATEEMQARYFNDKFSAFLRKSKPNVAYVPEWRMKCLDCPGKLYTIGPGTTLTNFEVHFKNRVHRQRVSDRLNSNQGT